MNDEARRTTSGLHNSMDETAQRKPGLTEEQKDFAVVLGRILAERWLEKREGSDFQGKE
jgi:hypothetical protein